jgi:small subunit ribosomal protein S6
MILMLDPDTGDEQREKIAGDVKSKLESGGEILHEANWGMRKMAYLIEKHESSEYRFFRFIGELALLVDLDHSLKITDGVLRFRIFKSEPDAPVIVPPDTEQIMRRHDDDDRERGGRREGGRGGPRRPRYEDEGGGQGQGGSSESASPAPAATAPAPTAPEAPAEPAAEPEAATEPVTADAE